ncbi:type II toxin-antitoxin system prevent-host-death family antitoxin [Pseudomonas sp. B6002]|uniref:type II toxin-antitoxin system Phd/YefM family antitoxin n=1 Tax=Pseudomonas sp. B6002 TaxID=2726978 RepID=UPI0015A1F5A1|nr:type II toxin-antitoxin system prevent-host-death family antitoxin [Pseudomonas sp. B6002]NVZ51343.1 type II toxin-antitoxin system prevent-host-death family antitoxin [Pseudomonas sp. B6002]
MTATRSAISITLRQAKAGLSELVAQAAAGETIIITRQGRAIARLIAAEQSATQRIGAMKGKLVLPDKFDERLPSELLDEFYG